jgi:hypothetical protein
MERKAEDLPGCLESRKETRPRTGVAWFAVGCQMGAYEHALRYATERTQFGRPIGGFQLVQDVLVRMLGNVTATQAMMLRLAQLQDEGVMRDEHASLAKAFCTVKCRETVGYARELLGGNVILLENHIGRFVADAEAIYSYEGTREMNTLIVGKSITGLSACLRITHAASRGKDHHETVQKAHFRALAPSVRGAHMSREGSRFIKTATRSYKLCMTPHDSLSDVPSDRAMPLYTVTTQDGLLVSDQRDAIASELVRIHPR